MWAWQQPGLEQMTEVSPGWIPQDWIPQASAAHGTRTLGRGGGRKAPLESTDLSIYML